MPVTIICEAGINHDGDVKKALRLCDAAKEAGADVIKFQTFNPNRVFREGPIREQAWKWVLDTIDAKTVVNHCLDIGIEFCSTPDDLNSLKWLVEDAAVKRIKLGSGSLLYEPLVDAAFDTGLPVLLSTGMATIKEIQDVVVRQRKRWLRDEKKGGMSHLTLMHCVSLYPCPLELANVAALREIEILISGVYWPLDRFALGYSDHTDGHCVDAILAAVALGATVVEKHLTLHDQGVGPDHSMSTMPGMFKHIVARTRELEKLLGDGAKHPSEQEAAMIPRLRKDAEGFQPGL